jgi:hypothetical protein
MKTFSVIYEETISREAVVTAKNKEEAIAKVKEVVGDEIVVTNTWSHTKKD